MDSYMNGGLLVMAMTIYLVRALPLALLRKEIRNPFIRSFLYYVPYATLAVMTFPAITEATQSPLAGLLALAAGLWMLALTASGLGAVVELMNELAEQAGLSEVLLEPVVKTVALSILTG